MILLNMFPSLGHLQGSPNKHKNKFIVKPLVIYIYTLFKTKSLIYKLTVVLTNKITMVQMTMKCKCRIIHIPYM
jgi:hypothetical protein